MIYITVGSSDLILAYAVGGCRSLLHILQRRRTLTPHIIAVIKETDYTDRRNANELGDN